MNEDFYITLIYKRLAGELSLFEKEQLEKWLAESASNRHTAVGIEKAWEASDLLRPSIDVDLDAEFNQLEVLIGKDEKKQEAEIVQLNPKTRRPWLSIAAGIAIVLTLAFLLNNMFNGPTGEGATNLLVVQADAATKMIELPDGSKVYLNENSELKYPETFEKSTRMVHLKGEAFFEVEHNPESPFEVYTTNETITVLGTSFNVATGKEQPTTVYVASGKVALTQNESKQKVVLEKGDKGISEVALQKLTSIKASTNEIAWHTHQLEFVENSLEEVIRSIEDYYNITVSFEDPDLQKCTFTATFKGESLEIVLDTLATVLGLEWEQKTTGQYFLKGGHCG
ncbi:MAG: FecR domain-containing protein [Chitinophagales bacterium]|nr:FecR domain-containing protein [Chitinophagales bacterium]